MSDAMNLAVVTASLSREAGGMFEAVQAPANLHTSHRPFNSANLPGHLPTGVSLSPQRSR